MLSLTTPMRASTDWYPNPQDSATRPDSRQSPRLWVIGDSHAGAYAPLLERFERESLGRTTNTWSAGCAAVAPVTQPCQAFVAKAMHRLMAEAKPGDLVFLPGLRAPRLSDQWSAFDYETVLRTELAADRQAAWRAAVDVPRLQLAPLLERGVRVVVELPKPVLPAPAFRCVDWFNRDNPVCRNGLNIERERVQRLMDPARTALRGLQQQLPQLELWDPLPTLCPHSACRAIDSTRRAIYFDGDHLNRWGNDLVYPSFVQALGAFAGSGKP